MEKLAAFFGKFAAFLPVVESILQTQVHTIPPEQQAQHAATIADLKDAAEQAMATFFAPAEAPAVSISAPATPATTPAEPATPAATATTPAESGAS